MEPKDTAYEKFNEFLSRINENYWDEITNEAETRKRIIDPIFSDVLERYPIKLHRNRMRRSSSCTLAA
jgi:hypothetical protein